MRRKTKNIWSVKYFFCLVAICSLVACLTPIVIVVGVVRASTSPSAAKTTVSAGTTIPDTPTMVTKQVTTNPIVSAAVFSTQDTVSPLLTNSPLLTSTILTTVETSSITSNPSQFVTFTISSNAEESTAAVVSTPAIISSLLTNSNSPTSTVFTTVEMPMTTSLSSTYPTTVTTVDTTTIPSCPPNATVINGTFNCHSSGSVPSQCCSFPFTWNGQLFYNCTASNNSDVGCFLQDRLWATCSPPNDSAVQYIVSHIPIRTFSATTTVLSVNNWIVFQQRMDNSVSFNQSWSGYRDGFGIYNGDFWMGLEKIYQLTKCGQYRLRFEFLTKVNVTWSSAEYDTFYIESEMTSYTVHVTGYSGDNGDVMNAPFVSGTSPSYVSNGQVFSTPDRNGNNAVNICALKYVIQGWWAKDCTLIHINYEYKAFSAVHTIPAGYRNDVLSISRVMMRLI